MTLPRGGGVARRALEASYFAMLTLAEKKGGPVFPASYREIAETAGLGLRSTYKAVRELIRRELVKVRRKGRGTKGSTWRLVLRKEDQLTTLSPRDTDGLDDSVVPRGTIYNDRTIWGNISRFHNHDLFRYRAFGKTAGMITAHLSIDCPLTPRELAQRCHCTTATAKRVLKRLAENGIAVQALTKKEWLRGSASLDEVAVTTGAAGRGEKQKRQHQVERDQYARLLRHWRRGPLKMVRKRSNECHREPTKETRKGG
ncbi:MAG: hypothetical protein IT294_07195 [Deltaproteobacteria bacterium]|nr:hypothetical protein [Deltaproteobacteria bacterium]